MMMTATGAERRPPLGSILPARFYFSAALAILRVARILLGHGLIGSTGMGRALYWSHALSRVGIEAWRNQKGAAQSRRGR